MAISIGKPNITSELILSEVTESDILEHYFGVRNIPYIISSPLRPDKHPSFGIYSKDGSKVLWTDLKTRDAGGIFDLLGRFWGENYDEVLLHIWKDLPGIKHTDGCKSLNRTGLVRSIKDREPVELQCKVRDWRDYDYEFWSSFGISKEWLKLADIYAISHKIVIKGNNRYVFAADKYAYVYVEFKEGKTTFKFYQPFNKKGFKWASSHDRSVISLWTKIPEYGEKVCICASLKDALCLWANTGIPALAPQGEGYGMSDTAIGELKRRYNKQYILLDNDEAGLIDGEKLAKLTGFTNLVLPNIDGKKDISDLYKHLKDPIRFKEIIVALFEGN